MGWPYITDCGPQRLRRTIAPDVETLARRADRSCLYAFTLGANSLIHINARVAQTAKKIILCASSVTQGATETAAPIFWLLAKSPRSTGSDSAVGSAADRPLPPEQCYRGSDFSQATGLSKNND